MLFNSITFLVFFAIVIVLHNVPFSWRVKKFNLLIASYIFYATWNPPFVILIWISTLVDWFAASRMHGVKTVARRRMYLLLSLCSNLGLLGFFKYGGFVLENFVAIVQGLGFDYEPAAPSIILPVGISFYTFQTLSYTIDVYRGSTKPWRSFLDFALFVTFFPQLVAGPIVRAVDFLPQCIKPRRASGRQLSWGLSLLIIGLFQKIVIADSFMAPVVDAVYATTGEVSFLNAWCGALAFSTQIFCDFAGYSTCAIGAALCLGFELPDNFRSPYAAIGFADLWRRWHISLSSWLGDYVYFSMGGSRKGEIRTSFNLMVTMLLAGLWHGASWTFVAWGGLIGSYLLVERLIKRLGLFPSESSALWKLLFTAGLTHLGWCFGAIFFRGQSIGQSFELARSMFGLRAVAAPGVLPSWDIVLVCLTTCGLVGTHWFMRDTTLESVANRSPWWVQALVLACCMVAIAATPGGDSAFIYFQF